MAELKIGEQSKPRFEFRSFGQCFCEQHKRMARLSVPVPEKVWERVEVEPMNVVVLNGELQQAPKAAEKKPARGFFDRCEEIEDRAICKKSDVKFYPDK